MKQILFLFTLIVIVGTLNAQSQLLQEKDIPKLNSIIKSLEKTYRNEKTPICMSLPQTSASFFQIVTKEPDKFFSSFKKSRNIKYLLRRNPNMVLLNNNNLLVMEIPKDYTLPGYSFEELVTKKEEFFLSTTYKSYKLFNEEGEMLNRSK